MSTPEQNIATARRFFESASNGTFDDFDEYMIPEFVTHGDALFPFFRGRDGMKGGIGGFKNAYPDAKLTVEQIFADGDRVMAHIRVNGTQEKVWLGVPAKNEAQTWTSTTVIRFDKEGKMAERWVIEDELGMLQQLGLAPKFR